MKSCKGCIHENLESQDCMHCSRAYTDEYERRSTLTNAERIRIMADEELADFIINGCWGEKSKKMEKSEVIEWLQEEDSIPDN